LWQHIACKNILGNVDEDDENPLEVVVIYFESNPY
jgi:hypothetical protein